MLRRGGSPARPPRNDAGAIAVLTAITATVLLVVAALAVDLGNTWARRGQLQKQADGAAVFAAASLPAHDAAGRLRVAKAAVYYIACNPVAGQKELHPLLPTCPASPGSSSLDSFAQSMLASGAVSFEDPEHAFAPNTNVVQVTTPTARISFGFGQVAGAKESIQAKSATAKVSSPGDVLPVGLSLTCLTTFLGSAPGGIGGATTGVVPFNYIAPGTDPGSSSTSTATPAAPDWPTAPEKDPDITTTGATISGDNVTVTFTIAGLGSLLDNIVGTTAEVWFGRLGQPVVKVAVPLTATGSATVALPGAVRSGPGEWWVKVALSKPRILPLSSVFRQSHNDSSITVPTASATLTDVLDLDRFLACARLLDSPRSNVDPMETSMPGPWLVNNLRAALNHPLTVNEQLVSAVDSFNLTDSSTDSAQELSALLSNPSLAFQCDGSNPNHRRDLPAVINAGQVPNCVRVNTSANARKWFTSGFLTNEGRLHCDNSDCLNDTVSDLPGVAGTYNNDEFDDFIDPARASLLDQDMFYGLSTYLTPEVPVVTPNDAVLPAIYESPRFFWAPVISSAYTTSGTGDYPILTFRPVFLTQKRPGDAPASQVVDELSAFLVSRLSLTSGIIGSLLTSLGLSDLLSVMSLEDGAHDLLESISSGGLGTETAGLVLDPSDDGKELKGVRFMTIEPGALPPVSVDYDGPTTEYLGMGPKIVRLIR